jgi:tRNA A-37 threonylcarbamoyl transferase component Bud32
MGTPDHDLTLHRYQLVGRIAIGGMAEVFKAKAYGSHGFEKLLAIKRILPDLAKDPEFENRFISEAKLAVALTHANVVQVFDFGRAEGSLYIAMEYVDGPDLAALLKAYADRGLQVPVGPALHISMELLKGLDFAHRRGVVHRDVSPANILLSRAGEVKIADFGIAQAVADPPGAKHSRRRIMGKWRYMSPEQTRGEALDARSDLFSAGVVLYELLTGQKLFPGEDSESIVHSVCTMPVPRPSTVRGDLPPSLDDVLFRALMRAPGERASQASELLRSLLEISYSRSLVATALDVAEMVAEIFPLPPQVPSEGPRQVDELILAELGEAAQEDKPVTRVTVEAAPFSEALAERTGTATTFVRRGTGSDGIAVWEVRDEAPASPPVKGARSPAAPSQARRWPVLVLVGVALTGALAWSLRRGEPSPQRMIHPETLPKADAVLQIESTPGGAEILIDGAMHSERTPTTLWIPPSTPELPHALEIRLPGYRSFRDLSVVVGPGERVVYRPELEATQVRLEVRTDPSDADVALDGRALGTTPLVLGQLPADDRAHVVRIRKRGFADVTLAVALEDGSTVTIDRALVPTSVRYGRINLFVEPWANVYLDGQMIGEAPASGLKLPVGRQRLKLVNPVQKRQMFFVVDVPAKGTASFRVALP